MCRSCDSDSGLVDNIYSLIGLVPLQSKTDVHIHFSPGHLGARVTIDLWE